MEPSSEVIQPQGIASELNDRVLEHSTEETPISRRGTEAAPSEPSFSVQLKQILECLQGKPGMEPVEEFPMLSHRNYGEIFCKKDQLTEFERQVRLQVMEALGRCETLKTFHNYRLCLDVAEWEALLIKSQPNPVLEDVTWIALESEETETTVGEYWRQVFMTSKSIKCLRLCSNYWTGGGVRKAFAEAVSLGMSSNSQVALECLYIGRFEDATVAIPVAKMIESSPKLQRLHFEDVVSLDEAALQALYAAILGAPALREVKVFVESFMQPLVMKEMLISAPSFNFETNVTFDLLIILLKASVPSIHIHGIALCGLTLTDWRDLGRKFLLPSRCHFFNVLVDLPLLQKFTTINVSDGFFEGIVEFHKASLQSRNIVFEFSFPSFRKLRRPLPHEFYSSNAFSSCIRYILQQSVNLKISPHITEFQFASNISDGTKTDGKVQIRILGSQWQFFFQFLQPNTSIKHLDLTDCKILGEEEFKDLLELLEVNVYIETIDLEGTSWEKDGKSAMIKEALNRNIQQGRHFSVMRRANFKFDGLNAGKIFLCGSPYAGKTQFKATMMKSLSRETTSESVSRKFMRQVIHRTRGIEVEMLKDDEEGQVSIWDLAGQHIFRALHDLLFPRSNQACTFLFFFNPCESDRNRRHSLRKKPLAKFSKELEMWLRFIVSNIPVTGHTLPLVLVVTTHQDKCKHEKLASTEFHPNDILEQVTELRQKFQDVVDLCPDDRIYHINATSLDEVKGVAQDILQCTINLMEKKLHRVPMACSQLISYMWSSPQIIDPKKLPVWRSREFYEYCCRAHEALMVFGHADEWNREVLCAVASYLHDVGAVIVIPNLIGDQRGRFVEERTEQASTQDGENLVVVSPNWLTQNFLGELISQAHSFEMPKKSSCAYVCKDGFVNIGNLRTLVKNIMQSKHNEQRKDWEGNFETILELMLGLDLCYKVELAGVENRYVMPSIGGYTDEDTVCSASERYTLSWDRHEDQMNDLDTQFKHFGFRVQCRDKERTYLSWALFHRYQIHLRHKLREHGIGDHNFKFFRNYVEIHTHGHHIFVEREGTFMESHVDVLVRADCSKLGVDVAKGFVRKRVIDELLAFCASQKGCPGVQLVLSVIRTDCVEKLTPRKYRKNQTVLVSELKQKFHDYIIYLLAEGHMQSDTLFTYPHHWAEVSDEDLHANLPENDEEAEDLLEKKEIEDVFRMVGETNIQLGQDKEILGHVCARLDECSVESDHPTQYLGSSATRKGAAEGRLRMSRRISFSNQRVGMSGEADVHHRLARIESILRTMAQNQDEGFRQLRKDLQDFKPSLAEVRVQMATVTLKLNQIIGYTKSMNDHKIPCRPYFSSKDVSVAEKATAAMCISKAVCLHLMCESRSGNGPHFVHNQPGLVLRVGKEEPMHTWMRWVSAMSLKVISAMVEAGFQLTAGLGSIVPDLYDVVTEMTVPVTNSKLVTVLLGKGTSGAQNQQALDEAWWYLKDYLAPYLVAGECARSFKLHQVKYKGSDNPFAWLCQECMTSGRRKHLLD